MTDTESRFRAYDRPSSNRTPGKRISTTIGFLIGWALVIFAEIKADQGQAESTGSERRVETVIRSDSLVMKSQPKRNHFHFEGKVRVEGTNLTLECDQLEIVALREAGFDQSDATIGEFGTIQNIIAKGDVVIRQAGRRAEAGRAEVFPNEGKVILTDSPRVVNGQGEVSGWRITLLKDERRASVEADPNNNENRPTVRLSKLPDLGFEPEDEDANSEREAAQ